MATMVVGLFGKTSNHQQVQNDLAAAGFKKNEYIVFLVQHHDYHAFMVTSKVSEPSQVAKASAVYNKHEAQKIYNFINMSWEEATYQSFRDEIKVRAKLEIKEVPNIYVKDISVGIDSRTMA